MLVLWWGRKGADGRKRGTSISCHGTGTMERGTGMMTEPRDPPSSDPVWQGRPKKQGSAKALGDNGTSRAWLRLAYSQSCVLFPALSCLLQASVFLSE